MLPYKVALPLNYFQTDREYPVFYLMHGLFGSFENWTDLTSLEEYTKECEFIVVCPEGKNCWYTDNPSQTNQMFESYILEELTYDVEERFRVKSGRGSRAIGGLSMGGYGAFKFAFHRPDLFCGAVSMSGALDIQTFLENRNGEWNQLHPSIRQAFERMPSDEIENEDLFYLAKNILSVEIPNLPFFYIDCGLDDSFIEVNRKFSRLLNARNINHSFLEVSGGHDWEYWDKQIKNVLRIISVIFTS